MNCENLCFIGYIFMGIAIILAVFFLCFYRRKRKIIDKQLEQEYGKLKR